MRHVNAAGLGGGGEGDSNANVLGPPTTPIIVVRPGTGVQPTRRRFSSKARGSRLAAIGWPTIVQTATGEPVACHLKTSLQTTSSLALKFAYFCSCEGSKDRAICCKSRPSSAQCPVGQSPFLYAKRPLVCPRKRRAQQRRRRRRQS